MAERKRLPVFTTPAGVAAYPRLGSPDTKFKADGEYKVTLVLPGADAAPLVEQLDKAIQDSVVEARRANPQKAKSIKPADAPYKPVVDDEGNETGEIKFNFKMAAKITSKKTGESWQQRPDVFDAKRQPFKRNEDGRFEKQVGGGSVVKVAFEIMPFWTALVGAGISLRLKAVQVLKLVEYTGSKTAEGYGFGEEEGYDNAVAAAEDAVAAGESGADGAEETPDRAADDEAEF